MANSVAVPQDIIYNVMAAVGDDKDSLKQCALVSSSFLLPSRRQLFSQITLGRDYFSQGLHQFLVQNPVIQSFVRDIAVIDHQPDGRLLKSASLLAILRLHFCCLERFSIVSVAGWNWDDFSSELKSALSNVIHSSTLKTLFLVKVDNVPIDVLLGIHLTRLRLQFISPNDFYRTQSRSLRPASSNGAVMTPHTVVEQCVWNFWQPAIPPLEPIFFPFMCRVRDCEVTVLHSPGLDSADLGSFFMRSLRFSLTSSATLERLAFRLWFPAFRNLDNNHEFYDNLRDADVWNHLDSFITHPIGAQLRRVEIEFNCNHEYEHGQDEIKEAVLHSLPLLRERGILFVRATTGKDTDS